MTVKCVSEFKSDAEYQKYCFDLIKQMGLDDGYAYSIRVPDGKVRRLGKLLPVVKKISKSDQDACHRVTEM